MNDPTPTPSTSTTDSAAGDKVSEERLEKLQQRIDEERAELRADLGLSERHFIDAGSEEPVDDSIAPPG